jgi:hypothetical protein
MNDAYGLTHGLLAEAALAEADLPGAGCTHVVGVVDDAAGVERVSLWLPSAPASMKGQVADAACPL